MIKSEGLEALIKEQEAKIQTLSKQLNEIYALIPEAAKTDIRRSQILQEDYRKVFEERKGEQMKHEKLKARRDSILQEVPTNKDAIIACLDVVHRGTTIIYKDIVWTLKDPLRSVEIRWNPATSNLISRKL